MPIYEFKCEDCKHCFEKLVFRGDEKYIVCPECGGEKTQKMMSTSSFIGSGLGSACAAGSSGGFS
jgi:putative FmdB family regulatory protein